MKNIIPFLTILFFFSSASFSQDVQKLESYTLDEYGLTLGLGDTIILSNNKTLYNVYFAEYDSKNRNWNYKKVTKEGFGGKLGLIKNIYSFSNTAKDVPLLFRGHVMAELEIESTPIMIKLIPSLKAKEIGVFYNHYYSTKQYNSLRDTTLALKEIELLEKQGKDALFYYLEKIDRQRAAKLKNDEFLYRKEESNLMKELEETQSKYQLNNGDTIRIMLKANLSEYNFDDSTFTIYPKSTAPVWGKMAYFDYTTGPLEFLNFDEFTSIKSDPKNAEFFVKTNSSYTHYPASGEFKGQELKARVGFVVVTAVFEDAEAYELYSSQAFRYKMRLIDVVAVDNEARKFNLIGRVVGLD